MNRHQGIYHLFNWVVFAVSAALFAPSWAAAGDPTALIRELLHSPFGRRFVAELTGTELASRSTARLYQELGITSDVRDLNTALRTALEKLPEDRLKTLFSEATGPSALATLETTYDSARTIARHSFRDYAPEELFGIEAVAGAPAPLKALPQKIDRYVVGYVNQLFKAEAYEARSALLAQRAKQAASPTDAAKVAAQAADDTFATAGGNLGKIVKNDEYAEVAAKLTDDAVAEIEAAFLPYVDLAEFHAMTEALAKQAGVSKAEMIVRLDRKRLAIEELNAYALGKHGPQPGKFLTLNWKKHKEWWKSLVKEHSPAEIRRGLQDRLLANPYYWGQMVMMVGLEIASATVGELKERGARFNDELDYFISNMIVFVTAELFFGWVGSPVASKALWNRNHPSHLPATIWSGGDYGFWARMKVFKDSFVFLGTRMFGVSVAGFGAVETLRYYQTADDPDAPTAQDRLKRVLWNSFLVASAASTWTNVRYQGIWTLNNRIMHLNKWLRNNFMLQHRNLRKALLPVLQTPIFLSTLGFQFGNATLGAYTYVSWFERGFTNAAEGWLEDIWPEIDLLNRKFNDKDEDGTRYLWDGADPGDPHPQDREDGFGVNPFRDH